MTDDGRRDRYAAALAVADGFGWDNLIAQYPNDVAEYRKSADAAMAVADAEAATLTALFNEVREERNRWESTAQSYMTKHDRLLSENTRLRAENRREV